jgi:hypothetical protein
LVILVGHAFTHALARLGMPRAHGAAFTVDDRSVLALGASYSGKSTLVAAALQAGGKILADDAVIMAPGPNREPTLLPSRSYLGFRGQTVGLVPDRFSRSLSEVQSSFEDRWILERTRNPEDFVESLVPQTIWRTNVDRRRKHSQVTPMNQAETLGLMIQSTSPLFLTPSYTRDRKMQLPVLTRLAESRPGYAIRLGRDLMTDPSTTLHRLIHQTT